METGKDMDLRSGEKLMSEKAGKTREPLPGRMEALRGLPADVLRTLTKREIRAFLFEDEWPNSMKEKLKQYIVED